MVAFWQDTGTDGKAVLAEAKAQCKVVDSTSPAVDVRTLRRYLLKQRRKYLRSNSGSVTGGVEVCD